MVKLVYEYGLGPTRIAEVWDMQPDGSWEIDTSFKPVALRDAVAGLADVRGIFVSEKNGV